MCDFLKNNPITLIVTVMFLLVMPVQAAMKDPTRPPTATTIPVLSEKPRQPHWILTSTLVSLQRRTAVINDTVVSQGDRIHGAKVINIQPSAVQLRVNGQEITLMLLKTNVKSLSQMTSSRQGKQ